MGLPGRGDLWPVPSIAPGSTASQALGALEKSRATCYNDQALGPDEFRRALGHFATGVTIVTTWTYQERPTGLTASAMSSGCSTLRSSWFCVSHTSQSYPSFKPGRRFAVNVLASDQELLACCFASSSCPVSRNSRASRTIEASRPARHRPGPGRVRMHHRACLPGRRSHDLRRPGGGPRRARRPGPGAAALLPRPIRPPPVGRGMPREAHVLRWRPRQPCHVTREIVGPTIVRLRGPDMASHSPSRCLPSGAPSHLDLSRHPAVITPWEDIC